MHGSRAFESHGSAVILLRIWKSWSSCHRLLNRPAVKELIHGRDSYSYRVWRRKASHQSTCFFLLPIIFISLNVLLLSFYLCLCFFTTLFQFRLFTPCLYCSNKMELSLCYSQSHCLAHEILPPFSLVCETLWINWVGSNEGQREMCGMKKRDEGSRNVEEKD